jgi:glycosyltransferase involved in cell wall biosynthesis
MPKILFIAAHRRDRSPSQRFRFEQYIDFLNNNGYKCEFSNLLSENDDKVFYTPNRYFGKLSIFIKTFFRRLVDVLKSSSFDIVFVQREAFMTGSAFFEKMFKLRGAKLVFDFDDAIWHLDTSLANKRFEFLKDPSKTERIISISDLIFAGNKYLADYASSFNRNVEVVPTTIDLSEYQRIIGIKSNKSKICIGWSGSITTIKHFEFAIPFLKIIKEKYRDKIEIKVIGDKNYINNELDIKGLAWSKKDEIVELSTFDIGIMPLPDDEWAKGKCGLKGLQYMALEIPTIMSPVGVNTEIIDDGINGFLATTVDEWVEKISRLIENESLRVQIGREARNTVSERYSVESQKKRYLELFNKLTNNQNH